MPERSFRYPGFFDTNACLLWVVVGLLFMAACSRPQDPGTARSNEVEDTAAAPAATDSLGCHPYWYQHADFDDIDSLRQLLSSADSVIACNFNMPMSELPGDFVAHDDVIDWPAGTACNDCGNIRRLDGGQRTRLLRIATDTATYTGAWSGLAGSCFNPHHAFAFFLRGKLVAELNICFICTAIRTRPYYGSDQLSGSGTKAFAALCGSLGLQLQYDFDRRRRGP